MIWIAPTEKDTDNAALEKRLWEAADQVRANSGLKAQEYSGPILGITFLCFGEVRFAEKRAQLETPSPLGGQRAGVRVDSGHARPSDGRGAGGEGLASEYSGDPSRELSIRVSARRHTEGTPQDLPERQDQERLKDMVGQGRRFPFGLRSHRICS